MAMATKPVRETALDKKTRRWIVRMSLFPNDVSMGGWYGEKQKGRTKTETSHVCLGIGSLAVLKTATLDFSLRSK